MSATTPGARRITPAASRTVASAAEERIEIEPVVDPTFASFCAGVLLAGLIMAGLLAMGSARPVPAYAIFGAGLFGAVFGAFLMGALHLAVTDSRRHTDDHI